jgi:hypothetical protein
VVASNFTFLPSRQTMKNLITFLLAVSVGVGLRAAYGFFMSLIVWNADGSFGVVLRTPYDPAVSRNLELWSFYFGLSILVFLVLLRLYRRQ